MGTYSKEWLSKQEIKDLFEYPEITSRDLLLMRVVYYGAFRISEVLNSKKEDYKFEDNYSYLLLRKQKTDKKNWEKQPVPVFIYGEVINRYCKDNKITDAEYVFQTQKSNHMSYSMAYVVVRKWTKSVGIKKLINTHSFRRSRATHLLDTGMDIYVVSKFLRHKSIETTLKYLKLSKKSLYDKMKDIDDKIIFDQIK